MNILITGGASGLGESITKKLATNSEHFVYFTYHNSSENAKKIEINFKNTKAIRCNFCVKDDLSRLIEQMQSFDLQVLINNALSTKISRKHFHKIDIQDFMNGFEFNILPTIKITQQAISLFRKIKFGKIITILSSYLINIPPVGLAEYIANKAYIASLSKSWANENANFNITSNCISPSFMKTHLADDLDERIIEELVSSHPLKRLLTTEEVADSVQYLVKCSQHINGINLIINSAKGII